MLEGLGDQLGAAFPGQVDAVDNIHPDAWLSDLEQGVITDVINQTAPLAQTSVGIAEGAYDAAGGALNAAQQAAAGAQSTAMNVGQSAYNTSQAAGQALQGLGQTTYDQAQGDQAQLEALGQYLGLQGEDLSNYIGNQTTNYVADIDRTGTQAAANLMSQGIIYGGQLQDLAGQAGAAGTAYNPALEALGLNVAQGGQAYSNALQGIAGQSAAGGQAGAQELAKLASTVQGAGLDMYGRAAPTYTPEEQRAMLLNASGYADQLAALEAMQGPSAAQAQLNLATNQSMQNNLALARSGSGFGESAQAMSQAINQNALAGQDAANQSAILTAQENADWRTRQGANLGQAASLGLGAGQQYGEQAQFQANLQQAQQNANSSAYLQALGLAGDQQAAAANTYLQGLGQSGQLTADAAGTYLNAMVQSGQLTQQAADNLMRGITTAGDLTGAAGSLTTDAFAQAGGLALQGAQGAASTGLQGYGLAGDVQQGAYDQALQAILGGVQAGQSGTQLAADTFGRGADTMLAGNQLGLGAIDAYLSAAGTELQGYQVGNELAQTSLAGVAQGADIYQSSYQQALDAYNQSVANQQQWEQLGITQEQAETARQQNYFELIGAIANAVAYGVGEGIPG